MRNLHLGSCSNTVLSFLLSTIVAVAVGGCALFVSHYDAGAYQHLTSLKAYHVKFLEDNKEGPQRAFDEARVLATCDAGELRFREASEYARGKGDKTRVNAIAYLYDVFRRDCNLSLEGKRLLGATYTDHEIEEVSRNYDLAIEGETARVGAPKS